jgi:hypothetical protein
MELRNYIEAFSQDTENLSWDQRIEIGRPKLFDFDYPIFDINYKKVFETHFINNFYMSEIGFETEGLFKFRLKNWMNVNMPYFNKLFESELLDFDPLVNSMTEIRKTKSNDKKQNQTSTMDGNSSGTAHQTNNGTTHQTSNGTGTEDNFSRNLLSDTPESRLTITSNDGTGVIEYASKIEEDNTNNSKTASNTEDGTSNNTVDGTSSETSHVGSTSNTSINETEDYLQYIAGKTGDSTFSSMVNEYRSTFLRIEKDIFREMRKELFMLVY